VGYNAALLADVKFGRLDDGSLIAAYYTNLRAVLDHARGLGMRLVPASADFGYSGAILWHDPNLAEGLPVRDATFVARAGQLRPYEQTPLGLLNADFESLPQSGHTFPGWRFQDAPGQATFVDRQVKHGGQASLRMTDLGVTNPPHGNGRVYQPLDVQPFKYYHVSVWVKTQELQGGDVRLLVLGRNPNRTLQWNPIPVAPTQDWMRFDVTFNTLTHDEVLLYFGVWGGSRGTIWWDDGYIEPAGMVNLIRRPGAPLTLTSLDGSLSYQEGRDVEAVVDPRMGRVPWPGGYDLWHAPPELRLLPESRIGEGELVRASYYHTVSIYGDQVTASLTEPRVFDIVEGQLASLRREFGAAGMFRGWMLSYDEIRVHGWDETYRHGGGSPGENLAYNFGRVYDMAKQIDASAALFTWSDMFDPFHNAADSAEPYYLVHGNWSASWQGVPPDVTIINWNHGAQRRQSAEFFSQRGHRQILAGYYDTPPERFYDRDWLRELEGLVGIEGVMYTQWGSGYGNLEAWARHVWGDAPWVTITPPTPRWTTPGAATSTPESPGWQVLMPRLER
jgi:hypothetical protein